MSIIYPGLTGEGIVPGFIGGFPCFHGIRPSRITDPLRVLFGVSQEETHVFPGFQQFLCDHLCPDFCMFILFCGREVFRVFLFVKGNPDFLNIHASVFCN